MTDDATRKGIQEAIDVYQAYIDREVERFDAHILERKLDPGSFEHKRLMESLDARTRNWKAEQAVYKKQLASLNK